MPTMMLHPRWSRILPSFRTRSIVARCEESSPFPAGEEAPQPRPPLETAAKSFEDFAAEWQSTSGQDNWDGFRIEAANQVTKQMQAAHSLFLGTQLRQEGYIYQFGPQFQSDDGRTVLVARTGLDGGTNGRLIKKLGKSWELKASASSHMKSAERNMHECSLDYTGEESTYAGKLTWQGAMILSASLSQRVLPSLTLGGDLTLVAANGIMSIGQVGLRYEQGKDIFSATVNRTPDPKSPVADQMHEFKMQYMHRFSERLSMGSEFKYSHPDKESGLQLAYEYSFRQARVQGLLDTDGKVSCCVSDFTGFGFSGMIDYLRGDYKFGVVMHVLPQQEGQGPPM